MTYQGQQADVQSIGPGHILPEPELREQHPSAHVPPKSIASVSRPGKIRRVDRTQHSRWTAEEEGALRAGLAKHGFGKWQAIICDPDPSIGPLLLKRTNVDLKDKWRNIRPKEKSAGDGKRRRPSGPPLNGSQSLRSSAVKDDSRLIVQGSSVAHSPCGLASQAKGVAQERNNGWGRGGAINPASAHTADNPPSNVVQAKRRRAPPKEEGDNGRAAPSQNDATHDAQEQQVHQFRMLQNHEQELQMLQQSRTLQQQQQNQQQHPQQALLSRAGLQVPDQQASWAGNLRQDQGCLPVLQHQQAREQPPLLLGSHGPHDEKLALRPSSLHEPQRSLHLPHHAHTQQQQVRGQDHQQQQQQQQLGFQQQYCDLQQHPYGVVRVNPQVASAFAAGHELAMLQQQQARGQQPENPPPFQQQCHQDQRDGSAAAAVSLQGGGILPGGPMMLHPTPVAPVAPFAQGHAPSFPSFSVASMQPPFSRCNSSMTGPPAGAGAGNGLGVSGYPTHIGSLLALSASADAWAAFGLPFGGGFGKLPAVAGPAPGTAAAVSALAAYASAYGLDPSTLGLASTSQVTSRDGTPPYTGSTHTQHEANALTSIQPEGPREHRAPLPAALSEGLQAAALSARGTTGAGHGSGNGSIPVLPYTSAAATAAEELSGRHTRNDWGVAGLGHRPGQNGPSAHSKAIAMAGCPPVMPSAEGDGSGLQFGLPPLRSSSYGRNSDGGDRSYYSAALSAQGGGQISTTSMSAATAVSGLLPAGNGGAEPDVGQMAGKGSGPPKLIGSAVRHIRSDGSLGTLSGEDIAAIVQRAKAKEAADTQVSLQGGSRHSGFSYAKSIQSGWPNCESQHVAAVGSVGDFQPFRANPLLSSGSGGSFGNALVNNVRSHRSQRHRGSASGNDASDNRNQAANGTDAAENRAESANATKNDGLPKSLSRAGFLLPKLQQTETSSQATDTDELGRSVAPRTRQFNLSNEKGLHYTMPAVCSSAPTEQNDAGSLEKVITTSQSQQLMQSTSTFDDRRERQDDSTIAAAPIAHSNMLIASGKSDEQAL